MNSSIEDVYKSYRKKKGQGQNVGLKILLDEANKL